MNLAINYVGNLLKTHNIQAYAVEADKDASFPVVVYTLTKSEDSQPPKYFYSLEICVYDEDPSFTLATALKINKMLEENVIGFQDIEHLNITKSYRIFDIQINDDIYLEDRGLYSKQITCTLIQV